MASDLNWRQSERVDFFSDPGVYGLPLAAEIFELKHEFLPVGEQVLFLDGQLGDLLDLFLILNNQLD